jgi:hypothetical protein
MPPSPSLLHIVRQFHAVGARLRTGSDVAEQRYADRCAWDAYDGWGPVTAERRGIVVHGETCTDGFYRRLFS